jgi:DNA-binding winged helix-turn-helix (wHTH) protein
VERLPGHGRDLLEALRHGERTKEALVQEVWNVPRYAPQLHDAVVHTAIARLRRALGDASDWVCTTPQGYALAEDVVVLAIEGAAPVRTGEHEVEPALAEEARQPSPSEDLQRRIVALLGRRPTGISELASSLRSSEATVLRRLRELMARGEVAREGSGKRTRYVLRPPG